ncbi:WecB/TagA/CpsF family glycosyltransferase [Escherichia coli]|uniref:WecB/TagA/CpsF family glycosyltransferase n=1 Tax=Escherichia coli TaxID=562 RepID=UPI003D9BF331
MTRPSQLWIDLHLEWLIRFLGEPKRLWRRNFISTPLFLIDVTKEKIIKNIK